MDDSFVRQRIEQLSDKILNATDEAGAKDGMTVAEVVGCLEMCKAAVIAKAFEPMP
jgi:predicted metal-binding protein